MKVQIKDLKPNPFRDMKNYPINQEKIQSLTNSINQTGFWDNILARPKPGYTFMTEQIIDSDEEYDKPHYMHITYDENGEEEDYDDPIFEIAYGHHRLVVLKKLFKPDDYVNIPIRELDDPTMIRIMANENDENWGTNPKITNETVRVTVKYLKDVYLILDMRPKGGGSLFKVFKGLPLPKSRKEYRHSVISWQISRWLGGNWKIDRVFESLQHLAMFENKELDKEALESLPTDFAARKFTKIVRQIKNTTPEQQKQAAKQIIERQDLSESGMKSALLDEKYKGKEKGKEERDFIEFKNYVMGCTKEINTLNGKLGKLLLLEEELKPDMLLYRGSIEARDFDSALRLLISIIKEFLGKGETECQKQVVSK